MRKSYLLLLCIVVVGALGVMVYIGIIIPYTQRIVKDKKMISIYNAWNDEEYEHVLQLSSNFLSEYPDNTNILLMRGFTQFNLAYLTSKDSKAINNDLIWNSIFDIRQALSIDPNTSLVNEAYYVLGKNYYLLSGVYLSQAIEYLQKAIDSGYVQDDVYEFLAAALISTDRIEEAEAILAKGLEEHPTISHYLAMIDISFTLNTLSKVSSYIQEAKLLADTELEELALRIQEARLMMYQNKVEEAIIAIKAIIDTYPQSVEAYYYLGNAYELLGDMSKARYEWRRAYKMAPYWNKVVAKLDQDTIYQ